MPLVGRVRIWAGAASSGRPYRDSSHLTRCWREKDSNPRSPVRETFFSNPLIK